MPTSIFDNTQLAFKNRTNVDLAKAKCLFWFIGHPKLSNLAAQTANFLLKVKFPIKWAVKKTIYGQFCGGENKKEYDVVIQKLKESNIYSILDYSVEGKEQEQDFIQTKNILLGLLKEAANHTSIPCVCLKVTGIGRSGILEKISQNTSLSESEQKEWEGLQNRLTEIFELGSQINKPVYVDAEESWIQPAIDHLCEQAMKKYNQQKAIVYTTVQMYRHDRLAYLKNLVQDAKNNGYKIGVKVVRGAYIEKENNLALQKGYRSPIHVSKEATDNDYNAAILFCIENIDCVEICLGTHNEDSCGLLKEKMDAKNIPSNDPRIWFSQLYGMSDHISYNLSALNYNVSKYLPFGPVEATMPYLTRRAQENSGISGQMSKELRLYVKELRRRKLIKELNGYK